MKPLFIIITWLIVILLKAFIDFYQIEVQKKNIRHGFEILLVAIVAFFHQWLSGVNKIEEWELAGWILLFQTMSYWLLFDGVLSWMRGKHFLYRGENSWTDRQFRRLGGSFYPMSKLFALVFVIVACVQLFKS